MNNHFLEVCWNQFIPQDDAEILISYLAEIGFDSFFEEENAFRAYIASDIFQDELLRNTLNEIPLSTDLSVYTVNALPDKNWNEEWEKNFSPVVILDQITIKAPFHDVDSQTPHEIIIEPKMSFGTGHHETTSGMLEMMLRYDFHGKTVIDMGTGTGILAVFAEKLGASDVVAIDNDQVCVDNSLQIIALNNSRNISVLHGDASLLSGMSSDMILANINRNVLLNDIRIYSVSLLKHGLLFLSGFYENDFKLIDEECMKNGLTLQDQLIKNNWMVCLYKLS